MSCLYTKQRGEEKKKKEEEIIPPAPRAREKAGVAERACVRSESTAGAGADLRLPTRHKRDRGIDTACLLSFGGHRLRGSDPYCPAPAGDLVK